MNNNSEDFRILADKQRPLVKLLTKVLVVHNLDGTHFSARLIAVEGNKLYFQNKAGETFIDDLDDIRSVATREGV